LLRKLRYGQSAVLLGSATCQWCISNHEEMETRKGDHVHGKLSQIAIELSREAKAACCTANGGGNEMIEISVSWRGELERPEANVVKSLIIQSKTLIGVLNELVH